ncbi:MAG: hypothetical protein P9M15_05830 [Candidatus Electryoneaceae bacterium]|nr:hypothetical protein [Candidatus Electryoneaceae bacterium]
MIRNNLLPLYKQMYKQTPLLVMLMIVGVLFPLISVAQGGWISHTPPVRATSGQEIPLEAQIEGETEFPDVVYIYYRTAGQSAFSPVEMDRVGLELLVEGAIPGTNVTESGIEYYIEAEFAGGRQLTFPRNGQERPRRVDVVPVGVGEGASDPAVTVLSPTPGARLSGDEVLIALMLSQHVREMDPANLRLEFNGIDVTDRAEVTPELITFIVKKLRPGEHRIALFEMSGSRKVRLTGWGFLVEAPDVASRKAQFPFKGKLTAKYSREDISEVESDITILDGNVRGKFGGLKLGARFHLTSQENSRLQPQNRYSGTLNYGVLTLKAGDISPRLSQFTMWGVRNRGLELNLQTSIFNLDIAYGDFLTGIEGTQSVVLDYQGNPLQSVLGGDSLTTRPGTYRRAMMAVRPGFKLSENSTLSFNLLKVKDDDTSIDFGTAPTDNVVIGADLTIQSTNRRFQFSTETAISLYNSDISSGPLDDMEEFEKLIIINQFFEPMPTDTVVLSSESSQADKLDGILEELIASSMAHETSLSLNYFNNELKLTYKTIGRSFHSLGSPGIQTDVKGFAVSDRMRLFNNRVYLNVGYNSYQDNVNGRTSEELDLHRNTISGGLAYYTPPEYPNISFNTRMYNRSNDAAIDSVQLPDGQWRTSGDPVGDATTSYDFAIDQSIPFAGFKNTAVLSYNTSTSEDDYFDDRASNLSSLNIRLSSKRGKQIQASLGWSMTNQTSLNETNIVDYNAISANGRYMILPDILWVSGGVNGTFASGGLTPEVPNPTAQDTSVASVIGSTLDFKRMQFTIGLDAEIGIHHKIGFSAYMVNHTDDGYIEQWDWEWDAGNSSWTQLPSTTMANDIDQNDLVARLKYTFKF